MVRSVIRLLLTAYGLSLLLVFYSPIVDYLERSLQVPEDVRPAPAIVVLTASVSPRGVLSESAMRRTHRAARLYRAGLSPLVIISGGGPNPQAVDFMAQFAVELGLPSSAVLLEKESENTHASAVHLAALCRQRGIRRVLLVTDAVHMRRAVGALQTEHLSVSPVPADPWTVDSADPQVRLRLFWAVLHEYGGLLYYKWKGWI